jgi:diguanylate cyclase (GGDEF)-like protein
MTESTEPIAALAAVAALLATLFFLFRSLPWSRPGPWRRIWALAALGALLFIVAEVPALLDPAQPVGALAHQMALFGAILASLAGFVATYFESRRGAERERALAQTDPLTALRNRGALQARVAQALEGREPFAVLWVDLDAFHLVNDALGSEAGDAVLRRAGQAIGGVGRSVDLAARVGGDAFALFLGSAEAPAVRLVAARVLSELAAIGASLPQAQPLSASFGAALRVDGQTARQILEAAEAAVARASGSGGGHLAYAEEAIVVRLAGAPIVRTRIVASVGDVARFLETASAREDAAGASRSLDDLLANLWYEMRDVIPYDRIGIALLEDKGRILRARWARAAYPERLRISHGYSAPMAGSSLEEVLRRRKPRIISDLSDYLALKPESMPTRLMVEEGVRSSLTCPLLVGDAAVGFMFFSSREPNTYDQLHADTFEHIATLVSAAVARGAVGHAELVASGRVAHT